MAKKKKGKKKKAKFEIDPDLVDLPLEQLDMDSKLNVSQLEQL